MTVIEVILFILIKKQKKAEILQAQEVFALVAMAELSAIRKENKEAKLAIAVNGPTSMRIDDICKALDVKVARSEVGEGNVVELAQQKRDEGYIVRILEKVLMEVILPIQLELETP